MESTKEARPSKHNRINEHMNSQRLCRPTRGLHRSKQDGVPVLVRENEHKPPSLKHKLFSINSHSQNKDQLSSPGNSHWVYKPGLFVLFYVVIIDACLFSNEREKERAWIWVCGETLEGAGGGKPSISQEKISNFNNKYIFILY